MIHVVAAAVTDAQGRVLIAQRPTGKPLAGFWEFPGGKREAGESRSAAVARELREELGIMIGPPRPLLRLRHAYSFGEVLIDMWVVNRYSGEPRGLDGQALRWCTPVELAQAHLLPADRPIVRALSLPARLSRTSTAAYTVGVSTDGTRREGMLLGAWCASVIEATATVADFLVMRHPLRDDELQGLCAAVPIPVYARMDTPERAWEHGATGVVEAED